ncbi:hypothetical protein LEP1GSC087_3477 [Leptospira interrogans serovar Bataviae str. L1111]|nr:hypothetical protein LEP1GSC087_3477 [Leptospira interrogans serovar Bataviae str. L1111]
MKQSNPSILFIRPSSNFQDETIEMSSFLGKRIKISFPNFQFISQSFVVQKD